MGSIRNPLEIDGVLVVASPTAEGSLTLKLTGLRVERDSRSPYKPRVLDLTVDDVSFTSRERMSPWTWEIENESVSITTESTIMIQPYPNPWFRRGKKKKCIAISGDLLFRLFVANAKPGEEYNYEHVGPGFRMFLSFFAQEDNQVMNMNESEPISQIDGTNDRDPCTTSGPIQSFLRSLQDLMQSLPPSASELCETGEMTIDTLQKACNLASTRNLDEDVGHLCEQVYKLLKFMQEPRFSGNLVSHTQTLESTLNLVACAGRFLEDYFRPELTEDLADPVFRKQILDEFGRQLTIMKSGFDIGKDVGKSGLPYTRKPTLSPSVSHSSGLSSRFGGGARFETTTQGLNVGTDGADLDLRGALQLESMPTNSLGPACLGRARIDPWSKITAWCDDNSAPNILWLCGAPGTGKTTISWSLIYELKRQQRCPGFFFFREGEHTPSELWRTLAFEMAKFHPAIQSEIHTIVTNGTLDKLDLNDVEVAFSKLVSGPLKKANLLPFGYNPVFLIDALDQCRRSQDKSWEILLNILSKWSSLPYHCKLIITSRHQSDIAKAFNGGGIERVELLTGDSASVDNNTRQDVRAYLKYRFDEMKRQDKSLSDRWPNSDDISRLIDHTKGSFKWAAVAIDSIRDAGDKVKRLTAIIEGGTTTKLDHLDSYLENVFKMVFGGNSSDYSERNSYEGSFSDTSNGHSYDVFRETMGAIALSKQPLTMADLEYFLQDHFPSSSKVSVEDVCHRLLPIISFGGELKIRHNSYRDYFIDSKRCKLIDDEFEGNMHRKMTTQCLKIMQQELKFNICGLKSSYLMNDQIEEKDSLIKKCIPSNLAYACRYWADHLHGIIAVEQRDAEIVDLLQNFLKTQLLYWLEVLSMLSETHIAPKSLILVEQWLEASSTSIAMFSFRRYYRRTVAKDLSLIAADASRFFFTFANVISASAPHIYLSALPFAPPSSLVSELYRDRFPRTIKVLRGEGVKWPAMRYSISTGDCVYDISIHLDGKRVAAAMSSGAMIFSTTTGESLFSLLGHGSSVHTIAYSPSCEKIATGCDDGDLRIYEAEKGSLLCGPFNLHQDWIRSIAWSPDGKRIVTGSDDRKVKVVVAETGQVIYDMAFHDDWVRAVLYTTEFFISGSDDRTVRIYKASTGAASGEAWSTGQTGYIRAIAISPDGKILAAGSNDNSIILYDTDTRKMIGTPIRGHVGAIRCLVFSIDSQKLASCSDDQTVRLWNVSTRKMSCDPLYGNTSYVSSVKFSPDMKQLVTGGEDSSIRFFNMESLIQNHSGDIGIFRAATLLDDGNTVLASDGSSISRYTVDEGHIDNVPFECDTEHLAKMQSVSISPNGQLVATVAGNRMIVIWKAESGEISCGPIEGHTDDIRGLGFSPDSTMVVSGSDDQKVSIWSAETGQRIHGPMEGHEAVVGEVCFSPDGKQVASGSYDDTAIIWSVESGEKVHEPLKYHQDSVCGLAYSPNGRYLATASDDNTVAIWDVATGTREFHVLTGHMESVKIINWSQDSKWIVTGARDYRIRVFDVETGSLICQPLTGHSSIPTLLTFRSSPPNLDEVVSASRDGTIRVWDLVTKSFTETRAIPQRHDDWILSVAFSPVQKSIATGGDDGRLFVTDSVSGDVKFSCDAHKCWIRCVTYSPNGEMIATCSDDSTIGIWDAYDGSCILGAFNCEVGPVFSIAFSHDGNVLISGNDDATVRSWALNTRMSGQLSLLSIYRGHTGPVRAVAYARMGGSERIVSGSDDTEIAIWDGNGDRLQRLCGHEAEILSISVSGDKLFSGSGDKTIRVWDLNTGDNISIIRGHTAPINDIKLSPDGRWVVSASDDGSLRIWDSQTGEPFTPPLPQSMIMSFRIFSVDVSRDGDLIAFSGADGQLHTRCPWTQPAVWPDNFMRKIHGQEYCPIDDQGILENGGMDNDGWVRGPKDELMCWIPPEHRQGLLQWEVCIVGAWETVFDMRNYAHGTKWEECAAINRV